VAVAAEVADRLGAPLDVIVVRKVGLPWQPELAIGAVAEGHVCVLNEALIDDAGVSEDELAAVIGRERVELERRVRAYRGERSPLQLDGRVVILVDDGLATGYTARAAIEEIRRRGASRVILAVPVAPADSVETMGPLADEFVVLQTPPWFLSIGEHYEDFRQTSDDEVVACLQDAAKRVAGKAREVPSPT
jgi:predicted phosphoribosyltransferase